MRHLFVPYYIAKALKDIGFDEQCFGIYDIHKRLDLDDAWMYSTNKDTMSAVDHPTAPIYQQAIDFLYTKGIRVIKLLNFNWEVHTEIGGLYETYGSVDDALLAAIDIVKRNNNTDVG